MFSPRSSVLGVAIVALLSMSRFVVAVVAKEVEASSYSSGQQASKIENGKEEDVSPEEYEEFMMTYGLPRIDASASYANDIIDAATAQLRKYGAVVLENLVAPELMDTFVHDLLSDESAFFHGMPGSFAGQDTFRSAGRPLGQSKVAQDLAVHNVTNGIVRNMLSPYCQRYVLGSGVAINVVPTRPGETPGPPQVLHRDDTMWATDWMTNMACTNPALADDPVQKFPQTSVSVMWALSDFTEENGATQVNLGSHKQCPRTRDPTPDMKFVKATMKKGSALLWAGGTFHGATSPKPYDANDVEYNTQDTTRRGMVMIYNLGFLRSEHNFVHALPREVINGFSRELLDLIGYYGQNAKEHEWFSGPVYAQPYLGGAEGNTVGGEGVQIGNK